MKIIFQILVVFFSISICAQGQNTIQVGNTTLTERSLLTGLGIAWDIVWGPDDHIWFTEREGKVKRLDPVSGNVIIVLDATSLVFNGNGNLKEMNNVALNSPFKSKFIKKKTSQFYKIIS